MENTIDLDAMRQARWAKRGTTRTLRVAGLTLTLPKELSLEAGELMNQASADMGPVLAALLSAEDYAAFRAIQPPPTNEDVLDILKAYGVELGEYAASIFSSQDTGEQSRPTSPTTTVSTSLQPAGAGAGSAPPAS